MEGLLRMFDPLLCLVLDHEMTAETNKVGFSWEDRRGINHYVSELIHSNFGNYTSSETYRQTNARSIFKHLEHFGGLSK